MTIYLISYDQHRDRNYTRLRDALQRQGAIRLLESVWGLVSDATAAEIRNDIKDVTHDEDSIIVLELAEPGGWASRKIKKEAAEWLKEKMKGLNSRKSKERRSL